MKLFLRRTKGSITVLVTLILVPTIFFTGFLTELARIKLYSDQALMTADNYGEAVISDYDNLLKELYGLFAVTQNEKGTAALKELESYMATSFNPNENTISRKYFEAAQDKWGPSTEYTGFMPYQGADVTVSYKPVEGANLGNQKVLTTQIGDFMRFRIAQQLAGDGEAVLEALEEVENAEGEAKVIDAKTELDDQAGKVLERAKEYYEVLAKIDKYPEFIAEINKQYALAKEEYKKIYESESYQIYRDYVTHKDDIETAREKQENLEEDEELSDQEKELIEMGDKYDGDEEAREDKLREKFEDASEKYSAAADSRPVDFDNYEELVSELIDRADKVKKEIGQLQVCKNELERELAENTVDSAVRDGINADLEKVNELFGSAGDYSADNYVKLAEEIREKNLTGHNINSKYSEIHEDTYINLQAVMEDYLKPMTPVREYKEPLNEGEYYNFQENHSYRELFQSLAKCFSGEEDTAKYEKKRDEAKNKLKEKEDALSEDEQTTARNIPEEFGFGEGEGDGNFALVNMIKEAVSYFELNSLSEAGNMLLLKAYTVSYDFGMFSSRVTNIEEGEEEAISLTGVKIGPEVNYLYGAELEYLLGGNNSSTKNLNLARNRILAFRAVINMRATYKIEEINTPIKAIKDACSAINPVLGIAVAGALRAAVAGLETYGDWEKLKKGDSVILIKNEISDLTVYEEIMNLLGDDSGSGSTSSDENKLRMNYEQYLMVMAIAMTTSEQIARRTGNLIMLNVNTVRSRVGADKNAVLNSLDWKLSEAVTAVDATCAVHLDFVIIPDGFAKQMTSDTVYDQLNQFEKNTYQFTVTRGY
ncbi:MAG: hypothetical protein HDQ96_14685 [Lachnospiraceae bacterium]|nr:hypothetical protein [Lachnospiraceae bacterium]